MGQLPFLLSWDEILKSCKVGYWFLVPAHILFTPAVPVPIPYTCTILFERLPNRAKGHWHNEGSSASTLCLSGSKVGEGGGGGGEEWHGFQKSFLLSGYARCSG